MLCAFGVEEIREEGCARHRVAKREPLRVPRMRRRSLPGKEFNTAITEEYQLRPGHHSLWLLQTGDGEN